MSKTKLKPCPFCGGEVSISENNADCIRHYYSITRGDGENQCKCKLFMESELFYIDDEQSDKDNIKEELIATWNRREKNDRTGSKSC